MTKRQQMSVLLKSKSRIDEKAAEIAALKDIKNCLGQKAVAILKNERAILALAE